ncbi:P-selectin-like [Sceloporus undulatus]|uniref:P-selectin-like n=1 Tax=Sceloporus undulatus TaxID=8520 RepID=UPI001C4D308B|nr:P-selectin-like [Sceloporus undulatus]
MEDFGGTWDKVKSMCKKEKAELVKIEDEAEQTFLYQQIKGRHTAYWLGLRAEDRTWKWDIDGTEPPIKYWLEDHPPYDVAKPSCALMATNCPSGKQCWMAATCGRIGRVLCKMKPQEKWMK